MGTPTTTAQTSTTTGPLPQTRRRFTTTHRQQTTRSHSARESSLCLKKTMGMDGVLGPTKPASMGSSPPLTSTTFDLFGPPSLQSEKQGRLVPCLRLERGVDAFEHGVKDCNACALGSFGKVRLALIARAGESRIDRKRAEVRDAHVLAHGGGAARGRGKDHGLCVAGRADKARHVFDDAQDRDLDLFAKVDLLADIQEGHLLRGGDNDGPVDPAALEVLHESRGARLTSPAGCR